MAIGLGHVVGMLLGHGQRYGKALVCIERAGRGATEWAVEFVKPDKWRADDGTECQVSDGTTRTVMLAGSTREVAPARPGSAPMALYPFFPIAAPIWGRSGDDWRMLEGPAEDDGKIAVKLESIQEPTYPGKLVIDAAQGHLVELRLGAYSIIVMHFEPTPPDPARLQP
jgi:hypothetical protein